MVGLLFKVLSIYWWRKYVRINSKGIEWDIQMCIFIRDSVVYLLSVISCKAWDKWVCRKLHLPVAKGKLECVYVVVRASTDLPLLGSGNPSRDHDICGVGLPVALHLSDTAGPGCSVCSMKLYRSTGGASTTHIIALWLNKGEWKLQGGVYT